MLNTPLIDLHTHKPYPIDSANIRINSLMMGEDLPQAHGRQYYSVGIHPYQFQQFDAQWLTDRFDSMLLDEQPIAIGEAGIDKSIPVPLDLQEDVFRYQAQIALQRKTPLVIHAVRAFPELIQIKKQFSDDIPWILHGFNGNTQTINQLLTQGFYFSVGDALLNPRQKIHQSFCTIPHDRLFFETDAADTSIESIYASAALRLNLSFEDLRAQIYQNFITHFHLL